MGGGSGLYQNTHADGPDPHHHPHARPPALPHTHTHAHACARTAPTATFCAFSLARAATFDADRRERRLYRDGVLVGSAPSVSSYRATGALILGRHHDWTGGDGEARDALRAEVGTKACSHARAHARTRPCLHTHACTHARTHARTHTHLRNAHIHTHTQVDEVRVWGAVLTQAQLAFYSQKRHNYVLTQHPHREMLMLYYMFNGCARAHARAPPRRRVCARAAHTHTHKHTRSLASARSRSPQSRAKKRACVGSQTTLQA